MADVAAAVETRYEAVIGIEIHCQLKTASKMFCGCSTDIDGAAPRPGRRPQHGRRGRLDLGRPVRPAARDRGRGGAAVTGVTVDAAVAR